MRHTPGLLDVHSHFVYGVDDGAKTQQDMFDMLDMAHNNGITRLYATSHSTPGIEHFPEELYQQHLHEARNYCRSHGYDMELYSGTEILYTPAMGNYLERKSLRTLGDSNFVLLEFVPNITAREMDEALSLVEEAGYRVILAHIERYAAIYGRKAYHLKHDHPVLYQVNAGTLLHRLGFFKDRTIKGWFRHELIDLVASDMHDCEHRRNRMEKASRLLEKEYGPEYAAALTRGSLEEL